jgi:hypothetical protein
MSWIAEGLKTGSLIWATGGSYNRKQAADLSGMGWIIFCKKTGFWLTGSFWEKSSTASSFCTEMLGLCALHLLMRTITEYHNISAWSAVTSCYNKRALELSLHHKGRIQPSMKCADIKWNIRATKHTYSGLFTYVHIYGHMDNYLSWTQLSLMQQINCVCDTLAKRAIMTAIIKGYQ